MPNDSYNEINVMQPSFVKKPGLRICKIDFDAQKINVSRLNTYKMIIILCSIDDKDKKSRFFE